MTVKKARWELLAAEVENDVAEMDKIIKAHEEDENMSDDDAMMFKVFTSFFKSQLRFSQVLIQSHLEQDEEVA